MSLIRIWLSDVRCRRVIASTAVLVMAQMPGCAGFRHGQSPGSADRSPSASTRPDSPTEGESGWSGPAVTIAKTSSPTRAVLAGPSRGDPQSLSDSALRKTSESTDSASTVPAIPPSPSTLPIDLPAALRLADSANPVIGEARARIGEALGRQLQAKILLLPTLNAGASYDGHAGVLQQSDGRIINVDRQSLYLGGGAYAVSSSTVSIPAVNIVAHLGDVIFNPLAAKQQVEAVRFDASATANSVLLGVAIEYLELQAAGNDLAARRRTEAEAEEVARITSLYAKTGEGRQADADRAMTQRQLRRGEIRRAEERMAVASARLARRLHLDPSTTIVPANTVPEIFPIVEPDVDAEQLILVALQRRPEVKARTAEVGVAETRVRQEKTRPFLPNLWLGYSGGYFGGGSNLVPPLVGRFAGRTDFDAFAYWSLLNFGAGNLSLIKRQESQAGVAVANRDRTINLVREQVASSRAEALTKRETLRIAVEQLTLAQDGYQKDLERIQQAVGQPLEVLNNLNLLRKARESMIEAVLGFNQAQFQLFVAMGSPPPLELPTRPAAAPSTIEALAANAPHSIEKQGAATAGDPAVSVAASQGRATQGPSHAELEALDRAKKAAGEAASEYDRRQAELFKTLTSTGDSATREELTRRLAALADAHRKELMSRLDYDKALWDLLPNSQGKLENRGDLEASIPPRP